MQKFLDAIAPYRKAIVAFFAPGLVVLANALLQGRMPTQPEWLIAVGTTIVTALGVYATPNAPQE